MSCPVMHHRQSRNITQQSLAEAEDSYIEKLPALPFDSNTGTVTNSHNDVNGSAPTNPMMISEEYKDEKEQRLAEFVAKMDQNRHTSGVEGFKNAQRQKAEALFQEMLLYTRQIELNILVGENEVFQRNEEAFFANLDEIEIGELKKHQDLEVKNLKARQEQGLKDLNNRKSSKKFQRSQQRELKDLYTNTQFRADLFKKTEEIKMSLRHLREKSAKVVGHIEERHLKQVKQFNQAEERGFADQKVLIELECQNLTEEQQSETMKKFQSKINHQKVINKKKLDHIREQQRLELRQYKEKVDSETKMIEELANLKETQSQAEEDAVAEQRKDTINEKEKVQTTQKSLKIMDMQAEHVMEMSKLQATHRIQLRSLLHTQKERKIKRFKHWSGIINRDISLEHASMNASVLGSQSGSPQAKSISHSIAHSRKSSDPNLKESVRLINTKEEHAEDAQDAKLASGQREWKTNEARDQLVKMQQGLVELRKKHGRALYALKQDNETAYSELKEQFQQEITEMEWRHEVEKKRLTTENDAEIEEALANQEKELIMEGHIRKAETKALIERKVLNNLLDTFVDGVISIDPRGYIKRFNNAAEKMFGYTTAEITESNMNIKNLMPKKYSDNHDTYLYNYFSTGVKKVIGTGRQVLGLKKDGKEFPIHLAISEVVEDGFHLFTAIVRDLTEVLEEEIYRQSTETQMMWKIEKSGKVLSLNQRFKEYVGITTKEHEDKTDVFSPEVVHLADLQASRDMFANANKTLQPFEIKRRLKAVGGTYRWFLTKGIPVYDTQGSFKFWCGACTDINDAVVLEEEMNTLQERLPVFLWKSNPAGDIYYGNSNFLHFAGHNFHQKNTSLFGAELCFAEDVAKMKETLAIASEKKIQFDLKVRLKSKKGDYKCFKVSGTPIIDGSGNMINFFGVCILQDARLENLSWRLWFKSTLSASASASSASASGASGATNSGAINSNSGAINSNSGATNTTNICCLNQDIRWMKPCLKMSNPVAPNPSYASNTSNNAVATSIPLMKSHLSPSKSPAAAFNQTQSTTTTHHNIYLYENGKPVSEMSTPPMYQVQQQKAEKALQLARQQQYQQYMIQQHILLQQQLLQKQRLEKLSRVDSNVAPMPLSKSNNDPSSGTRVVLSTNTTNTASNAPPATTDESTTKKPRFFAGGDRGDSSETSTMSYSGSSDGSPRRHQLENDAEDEDSNYASSEDFYDSEDEDLSVGGDDGVSDSGSLDNGKSLFTKQTLPTKRPSLLSVALQRTAFRNSQTALAGLATTSGAPASSVHVLTPAQQQAQIQEMVYTELTPSIRVTLMSDHARPFGTVRSSSGGSAVSMSANMQTGPPMAVSAAGALDQKADDGEMLWF